MQAYAFARMSATTFACLCAVRSLGPTSAALMLSPLPRCMHRLLLGFPGNVADFCDHPPTRILETARFAALSLSLVFRILVVLLARRDLPDCAPGILANFSRFHRQGTSSCHAVHRLSILRKL